MDTTDRSNLYANAVCEHFKARMQGICYRYYSACECVAAMSVCVCLSFVCLFVVSHISRTAFQISPNFWCLLPAAIARASSGSVVSGFVDDVILAHN